MALSAASQSFHTTKYSSITFGSKSIPCNFKTTGIDDLPVIHNDLKQAYTAFKSHKNYNGNAGEKKTWKIEFINQAIKHYDIFNQEDINEIRQTFRSNSDNIKKPQDVLYVIARNAKLKDQREHSSQPLPPVPYSFDSDTSPSRGTVSAKASVGLASSVFFLTYDPSEKKASGSPNQSFFDATEPPKSPLSDSAQSPKPPLEDNFAPIVAVPVAPTATQPLTVKAIAKATVASSVNTALADRLKKGHISVQGISVYRLNSSVYDIDYLTHTTQELGLDTRTKDNAIAMYTQKSTADIGPCLDFIATAASKWGSKATESIEQA